MVDPKKEGWTCLSNSQYEHYFRGGKSLCGKFGLFVHPKEGYEERQPLRDACPACAKKLEKERLKNNPSPAA